MAFKSGTNNGSTFENANNFFFAFLNELGNFKKKKIFKSIPFLPTYLSNYLVTFLNVRLIAILQKFRPLVVIFTT